VLQATLMPKHWNSIKTRVTVFTLGIFLLGMAALSVYVSAMLQRDLQHTLGVQQFAVATLVAADIDRDLGHRVSALQSVAAGVTPAMLRDVPALQAHLQERHVFLSLFNSGVIAYQTNGLAVAELPLQTGRLGINYADRDYIIGALQGRPTVGKPHFSKSKGFPEFLISVPIQDSQGQVIGVLTGVTRLNVPNFLDQYIDHAYGDSGAYVLVDAANRQVITATDKSRILEPLPAAGVNPQIDRFMQGYEGFAVRINSRHQSVLSANKMIPTTGWILAVVVPTATAFAPIDALQQRLLLAVLLFTLLAGMLIWWQLRRELRPMFTAVQSLAVLAESNQTVAPLPITRKDEIGKLIGGFNRLLDKLNQREEFLQQIFDTSSVAIFLIDDQGRIHHVNQRMAQMFASTVEQLDGREYVSLLHPLMREAGYKNMMALLYDRIKQSDVERIYCRDDQSEFWGHLTCRSFSDHRHQRRFIVCVINDITPVKRSETDLRIAATAFESQQGTTVTDENGVILRVNRAFTQITGYSAAEVVGKNSRTLASGRHDAAFYQAMWTSIGQTGQWQGEIWNRRKDGEIYPAWLAISAVKDATGQVTNYVATFSDISARKNAEKQINTLAFYDPLTHLPNRRLLLDRLTLGIATVARHQTLGALLYIDLDNFKTLNDTLGFVKGDLLLEAVAQRLQHCIYESDTVARVGGDEFVVMLEDLSDNPAEACRRAESVAEKIRQALNQSYPIGPFEHRSTPSMGVALFGNQAFTSPDEPLKNAELAMFRAKALGRNSICFFDPQMQAEVLARAALEDDLRDALQQQQLVLFYQAQVVGEGRVVGAEALVRWQHPQRGLVSPAEFIPLAEETGLILPLGQWVLETACAQLALWATQPDMADLVLAVNVSAKQFHQSNFVTQVQAALTSSGTNPKRLKLELTESLLVNNVEDVIAKMATLKALGISFSLDDFGTGYSSLSYLKRMPLDQLKIDQGFVRNILSDPNDAAIAKMVVALAESMGLAVIAEGVELAAQKDFLAHLGCHAYQGYFFSRPVPIAEFEVLARTPDQDD